MGIALDQPPSIKEASDLAQSLSTKFGIGKIVLFGSVANDTAQKDSDIDLVVIFDDLDYRQRPEIRTLLANYAHRHTNRSVDLKVTDRPEWKRRVEDVGNSFEASIAEHAVSLVDLPPSDRINWDKEIGLPSNKQRETDSVLRDVRKSFRNIQDRYYAKKSERKAVNDLETLIDERRERFADLCGHASLAIEHNLKALIAMSNNRIKKSHKGTELVKLVPAQFKHCCAVVPQSILEDMHIWREATTYSQVLDDLGYSDVKLYDIARRYIRTAISVSGEVIKTYESYYGASSKMTRDIKDEISDLEEQQNAFDLWTGASISSTSDMFDQPWKISFPEIQDNIYPAGTKRHICNHIGTKSNKPCILKPGHKGWHRYQN